MGWDFVTKRKRLAAAQIVIGRLMDLRKGDAAEVAKLQDLLSMAGSDLLDAKHDLEAIKTQLRSATYDAQHFEREFGRMEDRYKAAEERAVYWHEVAATKSDDSLSKENLARLAAQLNSADDDTTPTEVESTFRGFMHRLNEIHGDGWRPPVFEKDTLSGNDDAEE
jgi:chorismate mutase